LNLQVSTGVRERDAWTVGLNPIEHPITCHIRIIRRVAIGGIPLPVTVEPMLCNRSDSTVRKTQIPATTKRLDINVWTGIWLLSPIDVLDLATAKGTGVAVEDAPTHHRHKEKDDKVPKHPHHRPWLDTAWCWFGPAPKSTSTSTQAHPVGDAQQCALIRVSTPRHVPHPPKL
jgi:hypothetical protein